MPEDKDIKATEAAQKRAGELGVNLDEVQGTGQDGAIRVSDVQRAATEGNAKDARLVRIKSEYGPGEYVFRDSGFEEEYRIPAGVSYPVADKDYDTLMGSKSPGGIEYLEDVPENDSEEGGE